VRLKFSPIGFALLVFGIVLTYAKIPFLDVLGVVLLFGGLLAPVIEKFLEERKIPSEEKAPPRLEEVRLEHSEVIKPEIPAAEKVSPVLHFEPKVIVPVVQQAVQQTLIEVMGTKDLDVLKRPLALLQIEDYRAAIFSDDSQRREQARWALLEISKREDPILRRRCIQVFQGLEEYDEAVVERLRELAHSDPERLLRLEAQKAIEKLSKLKPNPFHEKGVSLS